jgi:hypothetical protein
MLGLHLLLRYLSSVRCCRRTAFFPWRLRDFGADIDQTVWDKYKPPFKFTGTLYSATVDMSGDMIKDNERALKVVMARQ